jgi:hypothetical protein
VLAHRKGEPCALSIGVDFFGPGLYDRS